MAVRTSRFGNRRYCDVIYEDIRDLVFVLQHDRMLFRYEYMNRSAMASSTLDSTAYGKTLHEANDKTVADFLQPFYEQCSRERDAISFIYEFGGETSQTLLTPLIDDDGNVTHIVAIVRNVSGFAEQVEEFRHLSETDSLTGFSNRRVLFDAFQTWSQKADELHQHLAILALDSDGLKCINDHFGHRVGDAVLIEHCRRMRQVIAPPFPIFRMGGDEFLALVLVENEDHAMARLSELQHLCNQSWSHEGISIPMGMSLGLAMYPDNGTDFGLLIDVADLRMYEMKRSKPTAKSSLD
jgi:diguanylate cyclase (GGDEF)-like protein